MTAFAAGTVKSTYPEPPRTWHLRYLYSVEDLDLRYNYIFSQWKAEYLRLFQFGKR